MDPTIPTPIPTNVHSFPSLFIVLELRLVDRTRLLAFLGAMINSKASTVPASVPVHRWQTAEAASSAASSASSKDCLENIRVVSVVMTKLKFSEIHWQIVSTDVVVRSDDAALQQSPERFNIVGVDFAANVFFSAMIDSFVALHVVRHASG